MKKFYSCTLIECQDKVHEKFTKLTALINIANTDDFLDFDAVTLKNYLWLLRDLVLDCAHHLETMERLLAVSASSMASPLLAFTANNTPEL
jgi:hypothetical protein